jgi:hypothetical protein
VSTGDFPTLRSGLRSPLPKRELAEAATNLRTVLDVLVKCGAAGGAGLSATLRQLCGSLSATAETAIGTANVGKPLLACFNAALAAGANLVSIGQVRKTIEGIAPAYQASIYVNAACLQMALGIEAKCYAAIDLVSRQDVDNYLKRSADAFDPAEEYAADEQDQAVYQALITLHAAVARDLNTRGRPLPKLVTFSYQQPKPALWIANRLYGDGSRADELIAENKPIHPLFVLSPGLALSA